MKFVRDGSEIWSVKKKKKANSTYQRSLEKYLNILEPYLG